MIMEHLPGLRCCGKSPKCDKVTLALTELNRWRQTINKEKEAGPGVMHEAIS
jgi:hypothetical protein